MAVREQTYSIAQVAAMLLYAPDRFIASHDPATQSFEPPDPKKRRPSVDEAQAAAEIMRRRNLSQREREAMLIGLADLDLAMRRLDHEHRQGVARFCLNGPSYIDERANRVEFQPFQARHVRALWRAVNGQ